MPPLKVTSWNAKVNRSAGAVLDNLAAVINDTTPEVICLQEAAGYVDAIRGRFDPNWYTYAKSGWDESRMNPVMVRKRNRDQRKYNNGWGVVRTTKQWVGPQGGTHKGRTWTWVNVDGALIVMSLHRCTDGDGKNKAAFQEEADALVEFIDDQSLPVLVIGDHNCGVGKTYNGASKTVAVDSGSALAYDPDDSGIDYAIRNAIKGTVNRKGKSYGSDHHPVVFHPA